MVKKSKATQSSFDFDAKDAPLEEFPEWHEVPQVIFLSWSLKLQLEYCIKRDEYEMATHENEWWQRFHWERAEMYREMLNAQTNV